MVPQASSRLLQVLTHGVLAPFSALSLYLRSSAASTGAGGTCFTCTVQSFLHCISAVTELPEVGHMRCAPHPCWSMFIGGAFQSNTLHYTRSSCSVVVPDDWHSKNPALHLAAVPRDKGLPLSLTGRFRGHRCSRRRRRLCPLPT